MLAPPEGGKEASPSFLEFRAIEPFDLPALLAGLGTADAFWVVADLAAGLSEKRICIVIDCLHLLPLGSPTPVFSAIFRPVSAFQRWGGVLTLPQRRKRHTGVTAGKRPHGRREINNATMQVTPMVIFLFCKDAGKLQCRKDRLQCCNLHLGICQNHFLLGFVVTIPGIFFLA